jgi:CubicO group peptidase (beta-lactamase class C family)
VFIYQKLVLTLSIISLCACSSAPQKPVKPTLGDYTHTKEYISWLIKREMADANVTGFSIALVDDKGILWSQGFGYADKQENILATSDTIYNAGSITKLFTATAAMQLAEQGKINIDQPLQKFLPEFSIKSRFGNTHKITPRNLLTHHSGLPCNWSLGMIVRHPEPFAKTVTALKDEYTAYPPDYIFSYSNLGMALLGAAIGTVTNDQYSPQMHTLLLNPLDMQHSELAPSTHSKSYDNGKEAEALPMRDLPASGLNSSVNDIAHFIQMVLADGNYKGKQILQPATLHEMLRIQNKDVALDFDSTVGLGWMLNSVSVPNGGLVASHGGLTMNFHSLLAVLPEHKLGVIVMSNSTTALSMVGKVTKETLKSALEAKRGYTEAEKISAIENNVPATNIDNHKYEGYFDTLIGLIKVNGSLDDLHTEIMGQTFSVIPHDDKEFGIRFKLFGFLPIKIDALEKVRLSLNKIDGRDVLALKNNEQTILIGEKLTPVAIPKAMLEFVGEYEVVSKPDGPTFDSVYIKHKDGLLIGEFTLPQRETGFVFFPGYVYRTALFPVAEDAVIFAGLGPGKGETIQLHKVNGETQITFSGILFRKITSG